MSDFAIRVEGVSKRYRIGTREERHDTLAGVASQFVNRPFENLRRLRALTSFGDDRLEPSNVIWALRDVSFEVKENEVVGIVGRNGSGKSTLLRIISSITEPTRGRVTTRGTVASLLEAGSGFHQEMTGRENV